MQLQTDLNQLQEREKDWQMMFNLEKGENIRITNMRKTIQTSYKIHGQNFERDNTSQVPRSHH